MFSVVELLAHYGEEFRRADLGEHHLQLSVDRLVVVAVLRLAFCLQIQDLRVSAEEA